MSASTLNTIATLVVSATTALLIAHWHRKQIRQAEAFRVDPTIGLLPPDGPVWAFVKRHWQALTGIALPLVVLWQQFSLDSPMTRTNVLMIAFGVASILYAVVMFHLGRLIELTGKIIGVQEIQVRLEAGLTTRLETLEARLADGETGIETPGATPGRGAP